jgi:septum formation protein
VAIGGDVLGKPDNAEHAREILTRLSGSTHEVITGLCVLSARRGVRLIGPDVTRITMRALTPREIDDYVAGGEGLGKAGAYAIQENGDRFVARIDGSFSNVVGLPMPLLADFIDVMHQLVGRE